MEYFPFVAFGLCKYITLLHCDNAVYVVTYKLMVMVPIMCGFMFVELALTLAAFIVVCPFYIFSHYLFVH